MSDEQLQNSRRAYYATITHIDYSLGLLFARMRETGLLENTWIIFTSDHGENLGDHHMGGKSNFMEGSAHIPLLIRPPAAPWAVKPHAGRNVQTLVTLADLMPTILGMAGTGDSHPSTDSLDGADLLSLADSEDTGRTVFGECGNFHAVIEPQFKYHYCVEGGAELLFDRISDPHEEHNLAAVEPEQVARLRKRLIAHRASRGDDDEVDGSLKVDPAPEGPQSVRRWPGFHSTTDESDVLH
jgi:arylsulfatase A-like enzyme